MADTGILTIAYGKPKYARQARTLARSIRHRSNGVPLAVASDFPAEVFEGLFDIVVPWDFGRWPGHACKLELAEITPFERTLFIDADCLCVREIQPVIDYFGDAEFAVYGSNRSEFPWADGSTHFREFFDCANYPVFNGGVYFFRNGPIAHRIFAQAQEISRDFATLRLPRPKGALNDELLISLAMAANGIRACDSTELVIMVAPDPPGYALDLDLLQGKCRMIKHGQEVDPEIVHFIGAREGIAAYRRERAVLERIVDGNWPRASRPLIAAEAAIRSGVAAGRRIVAEWIKGPSR